MRLRQVVGGIVVLFWIAPLLTLVMLAPFPVLGLGAAVYGQSATSSILCDLVR